VQWEPEADEVLQRVPILVRRLVRGKVEKFALECGATRVSAQIVQDAYEKLGPAATRGRRGDPDPTEIERLEREMLAAKDGKRRTRYYEVDVCAGAVGCPRSVAPVAEVAAALVAEIEAAGFPQYLAEGREGRPILSHHRFKAAVAGCPNACSQPQIRDFGAVGRVEIVIDPDRCNNCGECLTACQEEAIALREEGAQIDRARCLGCADCVRVCPTEALSAGRSGYRVLAGGKLGRHPRLADEILPDAVLDEVKSALARALTTLMREGQPGKRLGTIMENQTEDGP